MNLIRSQKLLTLPLILIAVGVSLAVPLSKIGSQYFLTMGERVAHANFQTSFDQQPVLIGKIQFKDKSQIPTQVIADNDNLLVTYSNSSRVDFFDEQYKLTQTLNLNSDTPHPLLIKSIATGDNQLFIGDAFTRQIKRFDKSGNLLGAWGWYPDGTTPIASSSLFYHNEVLYVSDGIQNKLLAVSGVEKTQIVESGEMLFAKSLRTAPTSPGSPEDMFITPDGRLVLADSRSGKIDVYSCMGDYYYSFETGGSAKMIGPNGIAADNIPSPKLIARLDSIFDPSDVHKQGRIHITDQKTGRVKVFDNQGKYILTYGQELGTPEDIAINRQRRIINIADSELPGIVIYKY